MHALCRSLLVAPVLVLSAGPATDLMAQTPGVEAPRPSFRDTRRLEAPQPTTPAVPVAPVTPVAPITSGVPVVPAAPAAKPLPSATPFAATPPGPEKSGPDKPPVNGSNPDKAVTPVKASSAPPKPAWLKQLAPGACGVPTLTAQPLPAGRMQVLLASACRAGEVVTWRYGGTERTAMLRSDGRLDLTVDGFAGTSTPLEIVLADSTRAELPLEAENLGGVTKVALVWRGTADLDLHAFEHAALPGRAGHVWSGAASTAADAGRTASQGQRGTGFLSLSDGAGPTDQVEVYTFVHAARESPGHIAFAVAHKAVEAKIAEPKAPEPKTSEPKTSEHKVSEPQADDEKPEDTTPDRSAAAIPVTASPVTASRACSPPALAEVAFRIIVTVPGQPPVTTKGVIAATECGAAPAAAASFDTALLPALRLGSR